MKLGYGVVAGLGQGLNQIANMGWRQFFMKKEEDAARERARQNMEMQAELNRQAAQEAFDRRREYEAMQQPIIAAQRAAERQRQLDDAEADRAFKREMEDKRAINNLKVLQLRRLGAKSGGQGGGKLSPVEKRNQTLVDRDYSLVRNAVQDISKAFVQNKDGMYDDVVARQNRIDETLWMTGNLIETPEGMEYYKRVLDRYNSTEPGASTETPELSDTLKPIDAPQERVMPDYIGGVFRTIGNIFSDNEQPSPPEPSSLGGNDWGGQMAGRKPGLRRVK